MEEIQGLVGGNLQKMDSMIEDGALKVEEIMRKMDKLRKKLILRRLERQSKEH